MYRIVNQFIFPRIDQISKGSREKDILSLLYILYYSFFIITISIMLYSVISPFLFAIGDEVRNLYTIVDMLKNGESNFEYSMSEPILPYLYIFVTLLFVIFLQIIFLWGIKRRNFLGEITYLGLTILAYIIYFRLYFVGIAVIGIIILLLTYIPIGKEKYYSVIQHLNYFEEVIYNYFFENPINNWKASLIKKALWSLVFIVIWDFSLISLFEFSVALSTVLCCSVILIVWFYKDRDSKEIQLLKKLIIYIIFFVVTIIGNYQISTDILKIPILFVSLFFALDRIIALSKEVNDLICSKSIIYYLDHNGIKTNNLLKEIIDVTYLSQIDISEIELVRQILIRYQLGLNEEIVTLSEIYHRNKEQNYLQLVDGISYFIEFEESWLDNLEELKERVNKIVSYKEQKIYYIRILKEYAFILYYMGDYSESIKYYEDVFMYLDKNEIDNLCKAYEACDQMDQANKVRKNLGIVKGEKQ